MSTNLEKKFGARARQLLELMLGAAEFPGAKDLRLQIPRVQVVGGIPTQLVLAVRGGSPSTAFADGPTPMIGVAYQRDGTPIGHLSIWVADGKLSGLELGWVTDDMPEDLPDPGFVTVQEIRGPEVDPTQLTP